MSWPFRKSRITTLAALVVGLLRKQQAGLAAIAQGMLGDTTVKLASKITRPPALGPLDFSELGGYSWA